MDEFSSGLSEQQLKYGYWYATHQILVQRVLLAISVGVVGSMLAWSMWNLLDWGIIGGRRERALAVAMQSDKVGFAGAKEAVRPRDLSVTDTLSLPGGEGKVDFVSRVKNSNSGWAAVISYVFSYGSAETPLQQGFVLPNEETWLAAYAVSDTGAGTPIFRAKEIKWMRVSPHEIGRYEPFAAARLRFESSVPQNIFVDFGGKRIMKTVFTMTNRSAYSYWHVPLMVMLEQGGVPLAVQTLVLDDMKSLETREVEVSWFYDVSANATPRIVPHVNILDPAVYMPSSGMAPATDIRERTIESLEQ